MTTRAYIKAISTYLPESVEQNNLQLRLTKKIGIYERHIAAENEYASDLAVAAAEGLFERFNINRNEIDFVILCTQSPDYFLPTTACILQHRLSLPKQCGAFDYNLGCSGYIYGLSMAKGLIETQQAANVLLITSETYSKFIHPEDNTVRPLFGDGATATLIAAYEGNECLHSFKFGTDGSGFNHLIVSAGGTRNPSHSTSITETIDEGGNRRTNFHLYMNGNEISKFALDVVPELVNNILQKATLERSEIDYYIFHQANKFMLDYLQQKCELQGMPFYNNVGSFGNTVSSSIPLAIYELINTGYSKSLEKVMLVGFGVGLSWAGCIVNLAKLQNLVSSNKYRLD